MFHEKCDARVNKFSEHAGERAQMQAERATRNLEYLPVISDSLDADFISTPQVVRTGTSPVAVGLFVRWRIDLPMSVGAIAMSTSTLIVALNAQLLLRLRMVH